MPWLRAALVLRPTDLPSDQLSDVDSPHDSESATPRETLCARLTVSDTARPPLTLSALPWLTAQPRVSALPTESAQPTESAEPRVSAQPTVSAEPVVSAQPTVSAVPCDSEVVVVLEPPWLSLWLVPPLTPELVESAVPVLVESDELALTATPEDCAVLSAVPVLCAVPVEDESVWLEPDVSDVPSVQPCEALTSPLTTPGMPAPTLPPTLLLWEELALEDWLVPSDVPWLCELPVELLSVCPVEEPALTVTPLPLDCDAPVESVCPLPDDQPLDEPSDVLQLVPSECAVPVDWLSVWEPESVWLELSVCEPLSVWLALSVCDPESV